MAILGTRGIPARYGGFETFAEQLAIRLVERGFRVTVYAEADAQRPWPVSHQGVDIEAVSVPRFGAASVIAYDVRCLWRARRRHDLVYMLGYGAAFACWLPRLYGTPVWINVDGLEWARSKWHMAVRLYLRVMECVAAAVATRVLADAQAIADRFARLYPWGAPRNHIAYGAPVVEGCDETSLHAHWGLQPQAYFLLVARPEPENHVLEIAQGHELYRQRGGTLPLLVVGDHRQATAYCERLRAAAGPGVRLLGAIYDAQLLGTLRCGARAHVHGHSVGGTNPSLLEALGCGSPVIAHDNPYNREVLGDAGDYFTTAAQLADVLHRLERADGSHLAHRRQMAREIIQRRYTWDLIVDQYQSLILTEVAGD